MSSSPDPESVLTASRQSRSWKVWLAILAGAYLLVAYLIVPTVWEVLFHRHPSLDDDPRLTNTHDGHPGDPLNVALVGSLPELRGIMQAAGWTQAAALGLESDLKIAEDTVLSRPDANAPVSKLYLYGRMEDAAYEFPVGDSPRQRHHVRFWKSPTPAPDGRDVWLGSASFDERVGLSHTTGQITHHIDGNVDKERDFLFRRLEATIWLKDEWTQSGFHTVLSGRNGGGDEWHTDGGLRMGEIRSEIETRE